MANITLLATVYRLRFETLPAANFPNTVNIQNPVPQQSAVTDVIQKSLPSVVTVGIDKFVDNSQPDLNPFFPFLPALPSPEQQPREVKQNIGSGFIISGDGLIITNKHVVDDTAATYTVTTNDNKKYNVINIYRDPQRDLAILKINAANLTPLALGDSSRLKLGQTVIAIGTPLGEFQNTVTTGIISGLDRGITAGSPLEGSAEKLDNVIQIDAPINPGNSGGPLLDAQGQVIGINTAIVQGGQNLGFAIPVSVVRDSINTFRASVL